MKKKILCLMLLGALVSGAVYAKTYTIFITKTSGTQGVLEFYEGGLSIRETCYFTNNPLQKGETYSGYIIRTYEGKDESRSSGWTEHTA
jgi:hypothetical protein